jgi:hypothetical protein
MTAIQQHYQDTPTLAVANQIHNKAEKPDGEFFAQWIQTNQNSR